MGLVVALVVALVVVLLFFFSYVTIELGGIGQRSKSN
jgi:hypothetical protein